MSDLAGGGAGGRIAFEITGEQIAFKGRFLQGGGQASASFGGRSGPAQHGGSGSVYIEDMRDGLPYNQLVVDNQGRDQRLFVLGESPTYTFDEVHLFSRTGLHFEPSVKSTATIRRVRGDGTGKVVIHANQTVAIEFISGAATVAKPPINIEVEPRGVLKSAQFFQVLGTDAPCLRLNGTLSGVLELDVPLERVYHVGNQARTDYDGALSTVGELKFATLELLTGSRLLFEQGLGMNLEVGLLELKPKSRIEADHFSIQSTTTAVHAGAVLDSSGGTRCVGNTFGKSEDCSIDDETFAGAGGIDPVGAGHGSPGGTAGTSQICYPWTYLPGTSCSENQVTNLVAGLPQYGSIFRPVATGARGGSTAGERGGAGGGKIYLKAYETVEIDGEVRVDAAPVSLAGGGSGGSVLIECASFKGAETGLVSATGGQSSRYDRGCGSGGRIGVHASVKAFASFLGTLVTTGGINAPYDAIGNKLRGGGAGTVYLKETYSSHAYHDHLLIDNNNHPWEQYVTLAHPGHINYTFSEIHMHNHASSSPGPECYRW